MPGVAVSNKRFTCPVRRPSLPPVAAVLPFAVPLPATPPAAALPLAAPPAVPKLLPKQHLQGVLEELYEALIHA